MDVGHTGVSHLTTRISFWPSNCVKTWLLCFYLTQQMCHILAVLIIAEELLTHQMSQIVSEESSFVLAATSSCKVWRLLFGLMAPPCPWEVIISGPVEFMQPSSFNSSAFKSRLFYLLQCGRHIRVVPNSKVSFHSFPPSHGTHDAIRSHCAFVNIPSIYLRGSYLPHLLPFHGKSIRRYCKLPVQGCSLRLCEIGWKSCVLFTYFRHKTLNKTGENIDDKLTSAPLYFLAHKLIWTPFLHPLLHPLL